MAMNRKSRRGAPKPKQNTGPRAAGMNADLFALAVHHHRSGRLVEAEGLYRQILAGDPDHADSLHLLGVVAHQVGRNDVAVDLIGRAVALDDRSSEYHYNLGLALAGLNRLKVAAHHFAWATDLAPDHADAHMNLGNALKAQGKLREAAGCYERTLVLAPTAAPAHYNLGNVLLELGESDAAIDHFGRAIAIAPRYAEAHNNLGTALRNQGRLDQAVERHLQALTLKPDLVEAHVNLGNALRQLGDLDTAEARYRQAVTIKPDYAEAHNNLASVLLAQGKLDEARAHCERAVALKPDLAEGYLNLARVLMTALYPAEALALVRRALDIKETGEAKALFVQCLRGLQPNAAATQLRGLVIRALSEPWTRPRELAAATARLIRLDGEIDACIARAVSAWPRRLSANELFGSSGLAAVCVDPLLRCLLETALVGDVDLERFLTGVRFAMLEAADGMAGADVDEIDDGMLSLACAIARQCFINEYVFSCTDAEIARASRLRDALIAAIRSGAEVPPLWPAVVAAYYPLHSLPAAGLLLDRPRNESLAGLLEQQIREPDEERQLRKTIPRLTAIDDAVSLRVQRQYEENPYPRWTKVASAAPIAERDGGEPDDYSRLALDMVERSGVRNVLVAGCGTGQQAIEVAQGYVGARVLAVDLSLTSLGYAARQTRAMGVSNIEYAQADILALGSIDRTFDVITASGVLHHLADPFAGWRVLLSRLRPGGIMNIGLYSALARREVVTAQELLRERHYGATAEDIRRCRQDLMMHPDRELVGKITRFSDFFSVSECRDLLFHVQEHRLTIPQIGAFLADNDLKFIRFDVDAYARHRYRRRFPADRAMTDLDLWHVFETENPGTFVAMYNFWVQYVPAGSPLSRG